MIYTPLTSKINPINTSKLLFVSPVFGSFIVLDGCLKVFSDGVFAHMPNALFSGFSRIISNLRNN